MAKPSDGRCASCTCVQGCPLPRNNIEDGKAIRTDALRPVQGKKDVPENRLVGELLVGELVWALQTVSVQT